MRRAEIYCYRKGSSVRTEIKNSSGRSPPPAPVLHRCASWARTILSSSWMRPSTTPPHWNMREWVRVRKKKKRRKAGSWEEAVASKHVIANCTGCDRMWNLWTWAFGRAIWLPVQTSWAPRGEENSRGEGQFLLLFNMCLWNARHDTAAAPYTQFGTFFSPLTHTDPLYFALINYSQSLQDIIPRYAVKSAFFSFFL